MKRKAMANFLTQQMQYQRDYARARKYIRLFARSTIMLVAIATIIIFAGVLHYYSSFSKSSDELQKDIDRLTRDLASMKRADKIILQAESGDKHIYRHILSIAKTLPDGVKLLKLRASGQGGELEGIAASTEDGHKYAEAIWNNEQLFSDALLEKINTLPDGRKSFTIKYKTK